jgi:SulP family sulfate permease
VLAAVGLTESLLTLTLIDQITETRGDSSRECVGQGAANIVTGLFSGMGGCAMIAQSMMNITSGGRRRLSGVAEACFILSFVVLTSGLIARIPMAALVGVMFVVVLKTFAWSSLRILHKIPRADAFVLVLVSVVTVFTNLATAVVVGVIVSALKFAWTNATTMTARRYEERPDRVVYEVHGPLFFGSTKAFLELFNPKDDPAHTVADFRYTRLHDHSALEAIAALSELYSKRGKTLHLYHLSPECRRLLTRAGDMVTDVTVSDGPHDHVATRRLALSSSE